MKIKTLSTILLISSFNFASANESRTYDGMARVAKCSASYIRLDHSKPSDRGMLLTNAQCLGFIPNGQFRYHAALPRTASADLYTRDQKVAVSFNLTSALYATSTGTDIALLELPLSFQEIKNRFHVTPITLDRSRGTLNTPIELASGLSGNTHQCHIEKIIPEVHEGGWKWKKSILLSTNPECLFGAEMKGAALISKITGKMIAIFNTGNSDEDHSANCTLGHPCEVYDGVPLYRKSARYAQQTSSIYSCINPFGRFDLDTPTCALQGGRAQE